jgi:hypothetical protein
MQRNNCEESLLKKQLGTISDATKAVLVEAQMNRRKAGINSGNVIDTLV